MRKIHLLLKGWASALLRPVPLFGIFLLPRYISNWRLFSSRFKGELKFRDSHPCLVDSTLETTFDAHYFFQAAWLARRIATKLPSKHVDVGSDVRMINVLSAFVTTEFVDYRPLPVHLDNLICSAGDLTKLTHADNSIASLSCLHVVEHVGLGRYGDPIDPVGSHKALAELERVLAQDGRLYLSVPVGRERVCFNAHRVFDPNTIVQSLPNLGLVEFSVVDDAGCFLERQSLDVARTMDYGCGMFVFQKKTNA